MPRSPSSSLPTPPNRIAIEAKTTFIVPSKMGQQARGQGHCPPPQTQRLSRWAIKVEDPSSSPLRPTRPRPRLRLPPVLIAKAGRRPPSLLRSPRWIVLEAGVDSIVHGSMVYPLHLQSCTLRRGQHIMLANTFRLQNSSSHTRWGKAVPSQRSTDQLTTHLFYKQPPFLFLILPPSFFVPPPLTHSHPLF